jgi:hypothetical protein
MERIGARYVEMRNITALLEHADEQAALIDKLVKALEPFAKMGATPTVSELLYSQVVYSVYHYFVVAGDFHNVAKVLAEVRRVTNGNNPV